MDPTVSAVLSAVASDDWTAFAKLVHPYVHWTADGITTRGRTRVMARLAGHDAELEPASAYELRDGQVYRWNS
ncbi:nuclear transport factor 2 family protein [Nocardia sp. SYP-A9097]|uniref:nuclear transport factor 2 family protein n=1 Tax=Nocardia sp. SYP-A9097 TaxID=2663237 RepID=UPI001321A80B|nr:nuclear transport factor 2 family protein [Nocardia sp. SYP-A9097]MRH90873.1 nuclear transport factor 2 family protein [Nocardia sp. SYP-A9097]